MRDFLNELASSQPTPGGGGASSLIAAVGSALCSMVANLTSGKKKYAEYQDKIDEHLEFLEKMRKVLIEDIEKDAEAFKPLAEAYSMDKSDPEYESRMEKAVYGAAQGPLEITADIYKLVPVIEELSIIGSRLAISDVAVAATAVRAALEGIVMNVYINTRTMKDRSVADAMNEQAGYMVADGCERLTVVYKKIMNDLLN